MEEFMYHRSKRAGHLEDGCLYTEFTDAAMKYGIKSHPAGRRRVAKDLEPRQRASFSTAAAGPPEPLGHEHRFADESTCCTTVKHEGVKWRFEQTRVFCVLVQVVRVVFEIGKNKGING